MQASIFFAYFFFFAKDSLIWISNKSRPPETKNRYHFISKNAPISLAIILHLAAKFDSKFQESN
jgi:hypothetical protein